MQSILKETNPGHVLEGLMLKPRGAPPGSGHSPIWRMPDRLQHGLHRSEQVLRCSGANLRSPGPQ